MNSLRVPGVRKIAVLRANGIGDLMFALPALDALRAAYPEAEIVLLASDWHRAFLAGRPGPVDRVVPIPASRGVREDTGRPEDPDHLTRFFERMRAERFDLALQLHGGGRHSNPFVSRLAARMTVGSKADDAPPLDRWCPYEYFQPEIARYLEVVALVGAVPATPLDPRLAVTPRDLAESVSVVDGGDARLVVLHPSASDTRRRWPGGKFADVGARLRRAGCEVFVVGLERDRDLIERVTSAMGGDRRHDLCGRLSLSGLAGLLSRAALVVSNDSGPLHLAGAVGAATVGVYWCGNAITAAPLTRTRRRLAVSWRVECPRCGRNTFEDPCQHGDSFVADVPVAEVMKSACDLLDSRPVDNSRRMADYQSEQGATNPVDRTRRCEGIGGVRGAEAGGRGAATGRPDITRES